MTVSDTRTLQTPDTKFWVLLTASMVSSLIMLDSNVVAVSLPTIAQSIRATFTDIEWVLSSYVLTYASLLLAFGNYADLYGRRKAMLIGLVVFAVASLACGIAGTSLLLNLSRALQGVGGAMLLTASLAIISHDFVSEERAQAFAFWGASLGIALALGPIIGGVISDLLGWRWIFLINLPLCAILILATIRFVSESHDPDAKRLDFAGIVTFSAALALLIWALIDGNDTGWGAGSILLRLAASAALCAMFVFVELRQDHPMVDFSLFRRPTFLGSVMAMIGYGASAQVMVFFLPLFLQNAYGFSPIAAGVAMLPFALPMVLAPRIVTRLATRFSGRALLTAGLAITVLGNLLFWAFGRKHLPYLEFMIAMLVAGAGAGLLNGQTVKVLGGSVPPDRAGMASGLASTTRFIGILVSVTGLGAILSDVVQARFGEAARAVGLDGQAAEQAGRLITSGDIAGVLSGVAPSLRVQLHDAALASFAQGFSRASIVAAAVAAAACAATFWFVRTKDTRPQTVSAVKRPCKLIDCRDPL
jgi:EmrB/QacA subfamily drug resistance transporter